MMKKIRVQNFKCLLDTMVELGPFNVLIGPNDSGKTSFLQAIQLLGKTEPPGNLQSLVWQRHADRPISLKVWGEAPSPFEYDLQLSPQGGVFPEVLLIDGREAFRVQKERTTKWGNAQLQPMLNRANLPNFLANQLPDNPSFPGVLRVLESSRTYALNPQAMREAAAAETNPTLESTGKNLASVLHALLTGPDRQVVLDLEQKLHEEIPSLRGISTPLTSNNGQSGYRIDFTLEVAAKPPVSIPASQASDGAMLLTGFLVLAYGDTPKMLLIEEPENGLHPSRLKKVIEILRKMSTGEIGNQARQIILTTHSPLLLNYVRPEEVRIFRRSGSEGTQVTSMSDVPNIDRLQREFAPGELWYLFGEEELVKGPAA